MEKVKIDKATEESETDLLTRAIIDHFSEYSTKGELVALHVQKLIVQARLIDQENKNMKDILSELIEALESISLSMSVHPDCTPDSEFADMVSIANDALKRAKP